MSDPNAPGAKVGTKDIPVEIQQLASTIKALPKTKDGLPVRKELKGIDAQYFTAGGTILRRNKGTDLLDWFLDGRLFTK